MPLDRPTLDLAANQGGILTRTQLLEAGYSSTSIDRAVTAGWLTFVKKGVYRALDVRGHDGLVRGAIAALPRATVSHQSAAHFLRFPTLPPAVPSVTVHSKTTHSFPGVVVHRANDLRPGHIVRVSSLPVTSIVRTLYDLAAVISEQLLDEIIEALVIAGRVEISELDAFVQSLRRRGKPGTTNITTVIERRLGQDGTVLEQKGLQVLRQAGVPEPVLQYPAPWNQRERIDAAWPDALAGIEWDSKAWHSALEQMSKDRHRDRQASLAGWVILRYTWQDLIRQPERVGDEVRTLLTGRWSNRGL